MTSVPILPGTVTVLLDGTGKGTAKIGPQGAREVWNPVAAAVSVAGPVTNEAQCKIFVGTDATMANYVDGTLSGSTGDSTGRVSSYPIPFGQFIFATWTGGDASRIATLKVTGLRNV